MNSTENSGERSSSVPDTSYADAVKLGLVDKVLKQFTSGRWLLTMAAALCLIIMVFVDARIALKCGGEATMPFDVPSIMILITAVYTAYFHQDRSKESL